MKFITWDIFRKLFWQVIIWLFKNLNKVLFLDLNKILKKLFFIYVFKHKFNCLYLIQKGFNDLFTLLAQKLSIFNRAKIIDLNEEKKEENTRLVKAKRWYVNGAFFTCIKFDSRWNKIIWFSIFIMFSPFFWVNITLYITLYEIFSSEFKD